MCSPEPTVNAVVVPMPAVAMVLLAVNVDPYVDGPVGTRAPGAPDSWLFPMREGTHAKYLRPTELAMYMNPKLRRTLLFLDCINKEATVRLWIQPAATSHMVSGPLPLHPKDAVIQGVDLARNSVLVLVRSDGAGAEVTPSTPLRIPLGEFENIWMDAADRWNLQLAGRYDTRDGQRTEALYFPIFR